MSNSSDIRNSKYHSAGFFHLQLTITIALSIKVGHPSRAVVFRTLLEKFQSPDLLRFDFYKPRNKQVNGWPTERVSATGVNIDAPMENVRCSL
jgi:hypothetical protein